MTLPPLFVTQDLTNIPFAKADGVTRPDVNIPEPGVFINEARHDVYTVHYPEVVQTTDILPTGTFDSTATWTLTVTPLTTQSGAAAAAHGMSAESVSYVADTEDEAAVVLGLIDAIETASEALTPSSLSTWNRIGSYVVASVSPVSATKLRLTARSSNATFDVSLTSSLAGDSFTETAIISPNDVTAKVGLYYALDTSYGTDGYDANGHPYIKKVTSSTPASEIIGPIYFGAGTKPVSQGFAYREYDPGQNMSAVRYGHVTAYGDAAIALAGGPEAVYVRHTDAGDYLAGMVSDATGAADGATANVWTGTPTVTNSVEYSVTIVFGLETVLLTYVSDGSAADTEIVAGLKTELAKYNTSVGQPLYGITASGTTTLILTGPSDGRGFTPATAATSPGVVTWVEGTPEVSTHTLLTRGDKFIRPSTRIGPVVVDVPHSNA